MRLRMMPYLAALLLLTLGCRGTTGPAPAVSPPPPSTPAADSPATRAALARTKWKEAVAAQRAQQPERARDLAAEARAAWPTQVAYVYGLALFSARLGDAEGTARWLEEAAGLGFGIDATREERFASVRDAPPVRAAMARLALNLEPWARSQPAFQLSEADFFPEGIACEASGTACYVTSVRHRKVVRLRPGKPPEDVVAPGQDGVLAPLAVALSRDGRSLWVASAALPQMKDFTEQLRGGAALHVFEMSSDLPGRLLRRLSFPEAPGPRMPGAIHITVDRRVFVSDSEQPRLYRVPDEGDTLETFAQDPLFRSLQGMAESADEQWLYVADYSHGLLAVDLKSRAVHPVAAPEGATVLGIDGLARHEDALIGVQNGVSPARVVRMWLSLDPLRLRAVEPLDRHLPLANEPTSCAVLGDDLLYIANSQWEQYDDAGRPREGARLSPPVILRLPLGPAREAQDRAR
ncbi:hypothetical protein P2318_33950 [Myxococcaceae bacterium GXIMD 01537]